MARKKQLRKKTKAKRSSVARARSSASRASQRDAHSESGSSTRAARLRSAIWTERPIGHKLILVVAVAVVLGMLGLFLVPTSGERVELNEQQREAKAVVDRIQAEFADVEWAFEQLEAFLGRSLPTSDSELAAAAQVADEWGRAFTLLMLKLGALPVPESLWELKELMPQSAVLYIESAENVVLLAPAAEEHRPALFAQAKRFLAMARGSEAGGYLAIRGAVGLPGPLMESEKYPIVADDTLAKFPDAPPFALPEESLPYPAAMAGVGGEHLSRVETQPAPQWANAVGQLVIQDGITETSAVFCTVVQAEKDGHPSQSSEYGAFLPQFRAIADDVARLTPPEGGLAEAASVIRSRRVYEEAAITGRMLGLSPEIAEQLRIKLLRLTSLAGVLWQWAAHVGQRTGIRFMGLPGCAIDLKYLFQTPWNMEEEMKRHLEGAG